MCGAAALRPAISAIGSAWATRAAATSHRGRLHPGQCRLDPPLGEDRISARRLCARILVHQRRVAGPFALCAPQERFEAVINASAPAFGAGLGYRDFTAIRRSRCFGDSNAPDMPNWTCEP